MAKFYRNYFKQFSVAAFKDIYIATNTVKGERCVSISENSHVILSSNIGHQINIVENASI